MADILIRGMKMPKRCDAKCPLYNTGSGYFDCVVTKQSYNWGLPGRPSDCPLHELPEHGDLVDREWLKGMAYSKVEDFGCAFLDNIDIAIAPVVIPSNKEDSRTMDEFMCGQECGNPEDGSL